MATQYAGGDLEIGRKGAAQHCVQVGVKVLAVNVVQSGQEKGEQTLQESLSETQFSIQIDFFAKEENGEEGGGDTSSIPEDR